jgi:hypothetical protein
VRSSKAADRTAKLAGLLLEERLVLPVEPHFHAAFGAVRETVIDNRCLLLSLIPDIRGDFLAAWLNNREGQIIRAVTLPGANSSPRTFSSAALIRLLDEIVVPVPPLRVQAAIAGSVSVLAAARHQAGRLITELWNAPLLAEPLQHSTRLWLDSVESASVSVESSSVDTQGTEGPHGEIVSPLRKLDSDLARRCSHIRISGDLSERHVRQ